MNGILGFFRLSVVILSFSLLLPCALYSETRSSDIERADRLGEEFQKQMPWSKEKPQSGEFYGTPQPKDYLSPPEKEETQSEPDAQYPYCYDPYTGYYEYCYRGYDPLYGDDYWRLRFRWDHGKRCPPGFHFKPGWGCYRR